MRNWCAVALAAWMLAVAGIDGISYVAFKLNQDNIANALCINKNKPRSCCQGKCFLDRMLKKDKEQQNEQKVPAPNHKSWFQFLVLHTSTNYFVFSFFLNSVNLPDQNTSPGFPSILPHPPDIVIC